MAARFDLFTLKLFTAVVEERSIARAAEREGIAASAVSKRISDLEQSLRVPLLVRMHRGVEATEAGRTLLLHARGILREMEELNAELAGHADGTRGQIRILTNETCIFSFLPEELRAFLKQHPQVRVELKVAVSLTIAQAVAENVADIGILTGGVGTGDLSVVPYHRDRLVAVTPSDHPLATRRTVRLADLLEHEIIDQERRSSISLMVLAGAARLGRPLRVRLRVESFDAMCRMVSAGLETGRVDFVQNSDIEYFDVPRLRKLPQLEFFTKGNETTSSCSFMDINHRLPKFQDQRFRKAMMLALDRKFIVDKLYFGLGKVADGPIASTTRFYDEKALVTYRYDPKQAIALLDAMGLKPDSRGVRERVKVLALPYGEVWNRQAELVKQQFGKIGIEVSIETTDGPGWYQRNANWDFELCFNFLGQFMHPAIGVSRAYISSNIRKGVLASNVSGYTNPKIDDLFARASVAPTDEEAQKLYSEIQHILSDDVALLYLTELQFPTFLNRKFHDVVVNAEGCYGDLAGAWMSA